MLESQSADSGRRVMHCVALRAVAVAVALVVRHTSYLREAVRKRKRPRAESLEIVPCRALRVPG